MKKLLILALFLCIISHLNAQKHYYAPKHSDSIQVSGAMGNTFKQKGNRLSPNKMMIIMHSFPAAAKEMKIACHNYDTGTVFRFLGVIMIGVPVATVIAGDKNFMAIGAVGAGLLLTSIPLMHGYHIHSRNAVKLYNSELKKPISMNKVDYQFGLVNNGIGMKIRF